MADADHSETAGPAVDPDQPDSLAQAEEAGSPAEPEAEAVAEIVDDDADPDAAAAAPANSILARLPLWLRRPPSQTAVAIAAAAVVIASSLAASGYMISQHIALQHQQKRAAEFKAAARAGVELMMSIDPEHARENIQRLLDDTTGGMQSRLRVTSALLIEDAQKATVATKATAEDVAVSTMTDDTAVVLVIAKSDAVDPDKSNRPPAYMRLSVELSRDGGRLKMSKVDFLQ